MYGSNTNPPPGLPKTTQPSGRRGSLVTFEIPTLDQTLANTKNKDDPFNLGNAGTKLGATSTTSALHAGGGFDFSLGAHAPRMPPLPGEEDGAGLSDQTPDLAAVSEEIRAMIEDVDVKAAVAHIREGSFLLKHCHNRLRKPHQRLFWVDMEVLAMRWTSPNKAMNDTLIYLTDVERIVPGQDSDYWRKKKRGTEERALGVELLAGNTKLRITCSNYPEWKIWLRGLLYAHQKAITKRLRACSVTNDFIRKQWELADVDQSGSIQFNELVQLLQQLNVKMDIRYAEQLFNAFDDDGSRVLEYDEFKSLIHQLLTHEDIMQHFETYKNPQTRTVTKDGYRQFLIEVQHTPASQLDEALAHIKELGDPFRKEEGLTDWGFSLLLSSEANSIVHPVKRQLYQDMSQPLNHYWISASHNTYLTGDQLLGRSAVGQYINVLLKGCRCVELDCWDGASGDPIIYHGHTLTSKISFKAVIKACRDYGFKKSQFPITLSLEMHCSPRQKMRVGEILQDVLSDQLYYHKAGSPTPAPQDLKGMFIVKGRVPDKSGLKEQEEGNEAEMKMIEREMQMQLMVEFPNDYCLDFPYKLPDPPRPANGLRTKEEPHSETPCANGRAGNKRGEKVTGEDLRVYYSIIAMPGLALRSFEDDGQRHSMHVASICENKFQKLLKTNSKELTAFHTKYISRVFPAGTRLTSSNYNPVPFWNAGCNFVALNYQVMGLATLLNMGRFLENGNCGYVLKPQLLRNPDIGFDPNDPSPAAMKSANEIPIEMTVKVLAAQQLPRPSSEAKNTIASANRRRDISCPYVVISLQGLPSDTKTFKTYYIPNNGLNPRWQNQNFSFDVTAPSLSVLVFEVRHYDSVRSDFLAAAAVPVTSIRTGIRWLSLVDAKFRPIQWSGLLLHVQMRNSRKGGNLRQGTTSMQGPLLELGDA